MIIQIKRKYQPPVSYSFDEINLQLKNGDLSGDDLARMQEGDEWKPLKLILSQERVTPPPIPKVASVTAPSRNGDDHKTLLNEKPSSSSKAQRRLKPLTAFPNILWVILYLLNAGSMFPKYGFSIATFARSLGICLIPLVCGIAWNSTRGEAKRLKWVFVIITGLFIVMFILSQLQKIQEANAEETSSVDRTPSQQTSFESLPDDPAGIKYVHINDPEGVTIDFPGNWIVLSEGKKTLIVDYVEDLYSKTMPDTSDTRIRIIIMVQSDRSFAQAIVTSEKTRSHVNWDLARISSDELESWNKGTYEGKIISAKQQNYVIKEWRGTKVEVINNRYCMVSEYTRSSTTEPDKTVNVWDYQFFVGDKRITLILSYKENENSNYQKAILARCKSSFKINK